jgi:hypothetical protein
MLIKEQINRKEANVKMGDKNPNKLPKKKKAVVKATEQTAAATSVDKAPVKKHK